LLIQNKIAVKKIVTLLVIALASSCSKSEDVEPPTTVAFENSGKIYFENNICKCPQATNGDQDKIDGIVYTAVNNTSIRTELAKGNIYLCTTLVTDMSGTSNPLANFFNDNSFNGNIGFWDVSNVTNMDGMFFNAESFNRDISNWDTSKVENMGSLFKNASSFNQDIGDWDTSKVTKMLDLFALAKAFDQDISQWDTSSATTMDGMFREAILFNQDLSTWCVENINTLPENFASESGLSEEKFPVWGTCP
jgi:surface protein